ncbi:MAG: HDOD domain-containing protein [Desulfurivibrionaceae bacterium]
MDKTGEEDAKIFRKRLELFRKIEFFKDFEDSELLQFQTVSSWLKIPPGTRIIQEGTSEKAFYIIVQGKVSVDKTGQKKGERVELTTLGSGDTFGEMAIVSEVKRTAGVRTVSECYLVRVEPDLLSNATVFLQLKFYRRFCEILVERLIRSNQKVAMFLPGASEIEEKLKVRGKAADQTGEGQKSGRQAAEESHMAKNKDIDLSGLPPVPKKKKVASAEMKHRVQSRLKLQMNPAVAGQLFPLVKDENTSSRQLLDLIALDPVLSLRVLQVANSSWFMRTLPVQTLAHAVVNVGAFHLKEVLAEEHLDMVTLEGFGAIDSLASSFWQHSAVVGRIADLLKDTISIRMDEDLYLAGLMHDLGTLVLDREEPAFYPQLLKPDFFSGNINEQEKAYCGIDHTWTGYWHGEKTGLPEAYLDVILYHHAPVEAKNNELLVALIHLSDLFARHCGISMVFEQDKSREIVDSSAWNIIRQWHEPFLEVNVESFIDSFNRELDRSWQSIVEGLPLS